MSYLEEGVFFNSHDPTTKNAQGPDKGSQYRSIAFYKNETEEKVIRNSIDSLLANKVFKIITTEVLAFDVFYPAEDYHQNYVKNHPDQPYVRAVSIPRFEAFKKRMPDVLKSQN